MSIKVCSRCYFSVQQKRKICDACGSRSFISQAVDPPPLEQSSGAYQFARAVGQSWRELKAEMIETSHKMVEASHKTINATREIIALVCNGEVEGGSR
jgi:hypothetical protein